MGKIAIPYTEMPGIIERIPELRIRALVAVQYACANRINETLLLMKSNVIPRENYYELLLHNSKNPNQDEKLGVIMKDKELWLLEPFLEWLKVCGEKVFELHRSRASFLITKYTGHSTHVFRHSRLTHLATEFNFDAYDIKETAGHAQLNTSLTYVHKKTQDRARKMLF